MSSAMGSTATVVGAGITGLAAAAGLARLGWDVTLIEGGPVIREDGAGLTLWPNAVRALDAIRAGDAVRDIGEPVGAAVVAPDLPGFGQSDMPNRDASTYRSKPLGRHRGLH